MYRHGVLNQLLPPTTPSVSNPAPAPPLKFGGVSRIAVAAMGTGDAPWQTYPEMSTRSHLINTRGWRRQRFWPMARRDAGSIPAAGLDRGTTTPAAKRSAAAPWLYSGLPSLFCFCFNILHAAPVICEMASRLRRKFFKFIVPLARWENLGFPGTDRSSVQTFPKPFETCKAIKLPMPTHLSNPVASARGPIDQQHVQPFQRFLDPNPRGG